MAARKKQQQHWTETVQMTAPIVSPFIMSAAAVAAAVAHFIADCR